MADLRDYPPQPDTGRVEYLADACDGFSGAEIGQTVVSALYTTQTKYKPATTDFLITEPGPAPSVGKCSRIRELRQCTSECTLPTN